MKAFALMFYRSKKYIHFVFKRCLAEKGYQRELQQRTQKHLEKAQWILTAFESIYQSHWCSHLDAGGTIINIEQSNSICIQSILIHGKLNGKRKQACRVRLIDSCYFCSSLKMHGGWSTEICKIFTLLQLTYKACSVIWIYCLNESMTFYIIGM